MRAQRFHDKPMLIRLYRVTMLSTLLFVVNMARTQLLGDEPKWRTVYSVIRTTINAILALWLAYVTWSSNTFEGKLANNVAVTVILLVDWQRYVDEITDATNVVTTQSLISYGVLIGALLWVASAFAKFRCANP